MSAFGFGAGFGKKEEKKEEAPKTTATTEQKDGAGDVNELVEEEEVAVNDGGAAKFAAVEVTSGEEHYTPLCNFKSKIWRFDEGENQWKERGSGESRILKHKSKPRHLFIFRREGVGKLAANHELVSGMKIQRQGQNEKAYVWTSSLDYADDDDEGFPETYCVKFQSKENADEFVTLFKSLCDK